MLSMLELLPFVAKSRYPWAGQVTLLVTCTERRWTLVGLLKYYEGRSITLHVLDSSKEPWELKDMFPYVKYFHYPACDILMYDMWVKHISEFVETEYVCWNNDDDFTTVRSLHLAAQVLNADKEEKYSMVMGEQFKIGTPTYGQYEFLREDREFDTATERLKSYFDELFATPHAVMRKKVFLRAAEIVANSVRMGAANSLAPVKFWDKILNFVSALYGNKKTIPCISSIRRTRLDTGEICERPDYRAELESETPYEVIHERLRIINPLAEELARIDKLPLDFAKKLTHDCFSSPLQEYREISKENGKRLPHRSRYGKYEIRRCQWFIERYSKFEGKDK